MAVFRLRGVVQHYAWGGTDYLPNLLRGNNPGQQPWAEYWLGIHPKGPAQVVLPEGEIALPDFLEQNPSLLSTDPSAFFEELPFLLKVLDVKEMLSIQLHPTIEKALQGFAKEEEQGIPRLAPHRNYKDQNHKPEVMIALTDFWLLHGFRSEDAIRNTLQDVPGWTDLAAILDKGGVRALYQVVMDADQNQINEWLEPLAQRLTSIQDSLTEDQADYWAWQAFQQYSAEGQHDRGIFSIYWFNLVQLLPGQGIFQGAGIPHAYLRGINVELMANSDNVLRGGLTPKHIDVPELLDNIRTEPVSPQVLEGVPWSGSIVDYPVPVPDFQIQKIDIEPESATGFSVGNAAIGLLVSGTLAVNGEVFQAGDSFLIGAGGMVDLSNVGKDNILMFLATF